MIALAFSCHEKSINVVDLEVQVVVKDKNGNNLLDPKTQGFYEHNAIKFFEIENGVKTEVVDSFIPRFEIVTAGNELRVRFTPAMQSGNGNVTRTNSIQWRVNDEDVIESTVNRDQNNVHCNKVKCNGTIKYDDNSVDGTRVRVIEIVK